MISAERYGPWAVVAGGSEGIGAEFARELGKAGLNLVLIARNSQSLGEVARDVGRSGVQVRTLSLDLTASDMLEGVREVTKDLEVGLLVYNAGADNGVSSFLNRPLDNVLRLIRLNSIGQASLSHHFGEQMVARRKGGIIIVGALAANAGSPTHIAYGGCKAFAQNFAEGLWWEFKQFGVDVLYVAAGATSTPASARLGLDKLNQEPGRFQTSADLVRGSLENLANGPVYVPPHLREIFAQFLVTNRREATEKMVSFLYSYTKSEELAAGGALK